MPAGDGRRRLTIRHGPDAPGMDTTTDLAAARVDRFLCEEPVVWLSTVRPDGAPHLVPTWFAWDGETIEIRSKAGAQKVRNLRADGRAMLAIGDAEADFDVSLLEADARLEDDAPLSATFLAKYSERIASLGLTADQFAQTYGMTIRLTPTKALGWHGRSQPASVAAAARRVAEHRPVSLTEPVAGGRPRLREWLGEPLARGLRGLQVGVRPAGVSI
jgi:PPOX class probable F420-dependent enzyme